MSEEKPQFSLEHCRTDSRSITVQKQVNKMLQGITSLTQPQVIYSRKMKDAECEQLNCHDARFGFAVSAVGDVDRDGYRG